MIRTGWSLKAVQQVMGHGSAAFTLSVYGHLFEDDLDALGEALDGTSRGSLADSLGDRMKVGPRRRASDLL
jgi:hypothetical protein